jgi:hypothetical protein
MPDPGDSRHTAGITKGDCSPNTVEVFPARYGLYRGMKCPRVL